MECGGPSSPRVPLELNCMIGNTHGIRASQKRRLQVSGVDVVRTLRCKFGRTLLPSQSPDDWAPVPIVETGSLLGQTRGGRRNKPRGGDRHCCCCWIHNKLLLKISNRLGRSECLVVNTVDSFGYLDRLRRGALVRALENSSRKPAITR